MEESRVYARYGVPPVPYAHEVDHLVSLEVGGSNAITNLWPEPYAGRWGARTKDVLEARLHERVCSGGLSLRAAQRMEARNWIAAYHRFVSTAPPSLQAAAPARPVSAGGFYASAYPTARTVYCADDPTWHALSPTYLRHYATWSQAHAAFPGDHLHQPC